MCNCMKHLKIHWWSLITFTEQYNEIFYYTRSTFLSLGLYLTVHWAKHNAKIKDKRTMMWSIKPNEIISKSGKQAT